jgi:hypothetical protein
LLLAIIGLTNLSLLLVVNVPLNSRLRSEALYAKSVPVLFPLSIVGPAVRKTQSLGPEKLPARGGPEY